MSNEQLALFRSNILGFFRYLNIDIGGYLLSRNINISGT